VSRALPAWDTAPHQAITRAALDSLGRAERARFGSESESLVSIYCMYPDLYLEMSRFKFVRRGAGPRTAAEIRAYCVRPDGVEVHGVSGDRQSDLASLVFLFERILSNFSAGRPAEAARYAGVLSHFVADSLSPPHAVSADELRAMAPDDAPAMNLHGAIERQIPGFEIASHKPRALAGHLVPAAAAVLDGCYSGAAENARGLPAMVEAALARDDVALAPYRLRAGVRAAEILSDALHTLIVLAEPAR